MRKNVSCFLAFISSLLLGNALYAQVPFSWKFILDPNNNVLLADMVVDSTGNTYVGVHYTAELQIPGLNKKIHPAHHFHGLIIKLNPEGKALWAHPFKSSFDNRINDLALAPNGDLLVTGYGEGLLCLPGLRDTVKLGSTEENMNFYMGRHHGIYAARYDPDGELKWAQYFDVHRGEGLSIAANKRNEVWLSLHYKETLKQGKVLIDSIPKETKIEHRTCIAVLNGTNGKLQAIRNIGEDVSTTTNPEVIAKLQFDHEDNTLVYGVFRRRINLTDTDSLTNDGRYDGIDSYIARLDQKGKLLWSKQISGQSSQSVADIAIAEDNSIYATGSYSHECLIGDGVAVVQKSKYKFKSGTSFFYLHLLADGELDFARYEESNGYGSYLLGDDIAIDQNGDTHICGYFTDTVLIDEQKIVTNQNYTGHYSRWDGSELKKLTKVGSSPIGSLYAWKIDINKSYLVLAGDYYGNGATLNGDKGQEALPNRDHRRITYLVGGVIATKKKRTEALKFVDLRETRLQLIKTFESCALPTPSNMWLPMDTLTKIVKSPCGQEVKGVEVALFPNPTQGETKLKLSGIVGRVQLEVFSLKGQLLFSHSIEDAFDGQIVTLNLANLANATYIVRVTHKRFQKGLKVVKL